MAKLIQHHIKYKELHEIDEIIMLTPSEHAKLHIKLRKEGKCNVSPDELEKISAKARERSPERKIFRRRYEQSEEGKARSAKYRQSEKGKAAHMTGSARYNQSEKGKAANRAISARHRAKQKSVNKGGLT